MDHKLKQKFSQALIKSKTDANEQELTILKEEISNVKDIMKSVEVGFDRSVKEAILAIQGKYLWYKSAGFGFSASQSDSDDEHSKNRILI
jgi:hypothetical protein